MKKMIRATLFLVWVAVMVTFFVWYGFKLAAMQKEREASIKKLEQTLDETAAAALKACKSAVDLCNSVGAKGCGSCQP